MKRLRETELSGDEDGPDGDEMCKPNPKIVELDQSNETTGFEFRCSLPPHKDTVIFSTYHEFESHYTQAHLNRCQECRKNFPSAYLLELHLEECHDSMVAVLRDRGDRTFSCFLETCDKKCVTPQKRRHHLIKEHQYPKDYLFTVTRDGIEGRHSLLLRGNHRQRRSRSGNKKEQLRPPNNAHPRLRDIPERAKNLIAADGDAIETTKTPEVEMEDLSKALSALQFVPSSIRFGRGRKGGFPKRQQNE